MNTNWSFCSKESKFQRRLNLKRIPFSEGTRSSDTRTFRKWFNGFINKRKLRDDLLFICKIVYYHIPSLSLLVTPIDFFFTAAKAGSKYVVSLRRLGWTSIVLYSAVLDEFNCLLIRLLDRLFNYICLLLLVLDSLFYGISMSSSFFLSLSKMFVDISRISSLGKTRSSTLI